MSQAAPKADAADATALLTAFAVRSRTSEMLALARDGALPNFTLDMAKLAPTADFVTGIIKENYPALRIPLHARWRHFFFSGSDLWAEIAKRITWKDAAARARAEFDLAIVSVLLDAGAGAKWRYTDAQTGLSVGRSEGLALASLRMFEAGVFSAKENEPLRADAVRLAAIDANALTKGFQVTEDNPLNGFEGRVVLLNRLGETLKANPRVFASHDGARPGGLFDCLTAGGTTIAAPAILSAVLEHLGSIWPSRIILGDVALGDTWRHPALRRADNTDQLIPFHKLSQWLTYSLVEPLQRANRKIIDQDGLTGLAEYRNGGLFVDLGVIAPRDAAMLSKPLAADSAVIVEWRALTVALLDLIAPLVRDRLGLTAQQMPLGSVLEGGTWAAGRKAAYARRPDGTPPLNIISDGTVF